MPEYRNPGALVFEFHISKEIRKKYELDQNLFATDGNVIFADFIAVRQFVYRVNQQREPDQHIYPGEVNAAGLIDEIYHLVLREYEAAVNPGVFEKAVEHLRAKFAEKQFDALLEDFVEKFPPQSVFDGSLNAAQYLSGFTGERSNAAIATEEAMMLFLANLNPAGKKLREFFDEAYLAEPKIFRRFADALDEFFRNEPPFGQQDQDVFTLLKTPLLAAKDLYAQLGFILENWKSILPEKVLIRILKGKDLMNEDLQLATGFGSAPTIVPVYKEGAGDTGDYSIGKSGYHFAEKSTKDYAEYEQFTPDTHWMPRVVVLAKNTYVWLDQLSKKYQREIRRLDQVPDAELDQLAQWNFNGLWLIGIWERSFASKRIKHIMGNLDAVSSAYSLFDYEIAADLGGEEAYQNLNERAKARGIRLASDMVPNHTGLYSQWVIENPDFFIQTPVAPFPGYRFTGENLSHHPDIEIRIEDGYYSRSDASVVFQRIDKRYSDVRYIYHGNDGTNMPWNDTAQLNMLRQEVREAVIQKIFDVARRFSIIRFDAAMTLAKKHFSRLWYPRPGSGGDIPSRADFAMSEEEFDALFPVEFWREVVDRMNRDMPETLLLAEAFWMMEGYFVRTLGMHRVYNSAFMHMLKNEENEKYRDLITNTLEFEPEILKRYVNFMSNPDEETAIRQFGSDDKYFGVCVLMSTLPGLPMFAHGQVEGYTEKYGMEYQRAYYNEQSNQWLVERHQREIFPLTGKRYIFSEVDHFNIFDFITDQGYINENVFAYTNRSGNERALVLYNNKYESASGRILVSAPKLSKHGSDKTTQIISLADALAVSNNERHFYIFKEHISGLEFLRSGSELHNSGFQWGLQGFEYRIFWNFREVYDENGDWEKLRNDLNGQGVPDISDLFASVRLQPVHQKLEHLLSDEVISLIINNIINNKEESKTISETILNRFEELTSEAAKHLSDKSVAKALVKFESALEGLYNTFQFIKTREDQLRQFFLKIRINSLDEMLIVGNRKLYRENVIILTAYFIAEALSVLTDKANRSDLMHQLMLQKPLQNVLKRTGRGEKDIELDIRLVSILLRYVPALIENSKPSMSGNAVLLQMLDNAEVKEFIGTNHYEGIWYYSKENFEELVDWLFALTLFSWFEPLQTIGEPELAKEIEKLINASMKLKELSEASGYQFGKLKTNVENELNRI